MAKNDPLFNSYFVLESRCMYISAAVNTYFRFSSESPSLTCQSSSNLKVHPFRRKVFLAHFCTIEKNVLEHEYILNSSIDCP